MQIKYSFLLLVMFCLFNAVEAKQINKTIIDVNGIDLGDIPLYDFEIDSSSNSSAITLYPKNFFDSSYTNDLDTIYQINTSTGIASVVYTDTKQVGEDYRLLTVIDNEPLSYSELLRAGTAFCCANYTLQFIYIDIDKNNSKTITIDDNVDYYLEPFKSASGKRYIAYVKDDQLIIKVITGFYTEDILVTEYYRDTIGYSYTPFYLFADFEVSNDAVYLIKIFDVTSPRLYLVSDIDKLEYIADLPKYSGEFVFDSQLNQIFYAKNNAINSFALNNHSIKTLYKSAFLKMGRSVAHTYDIYQLKTSSTGAANRFEFDVYADYDDIVGHRLVLKPGTLLTGDIYGIKKISGSTYQFGSVKDQYLYAGFDFNKFTGAVNLVETASNKRLNVGTIDCQGVLVPDTNSFYTFLTKSIKTDGSDCKGLSMQSLKKNDFAKILRIQGSAAH